MQLPRRHRTPTAWLALVLVALVTLAPTVSRAMAFVQGQIAPWSTLCESGGRSGSGNALDVLSHVNAHCAACHLQGDHLAPPVAASGPPPLSGAQPPACQAAAPLPPASPAWGLAQPRAPPRSA
jgi:Protein of unknown function (DUF2946)